MARPKDYLNDYDYCIRKLIAVHVFKQFLSETGIKQNEMAKAMGIGQPLLSKWINAPYINGTVLRPTSENQRAPSFYQIALASIYMKKPIDTMLKEAIVLESHEPTGLLTHFQFENRNKSFATSFQIKRPVKEFEYEEKNTDHLRKIAKLEHSRYIGFYLSEQNSNRLQHFIMETSGVLPTASVQAMVRILGKAEYPYRCNIISPPNQRYLYIYLRQDSGKYDRGIMFFHEDEDIQGNYLCGSGVMLSTERRSGHLCLQWVVIVYLGENDDPVTSDMLSNNSAIATLRRIQHQSVALNKEDHAFLRRAELIQADNTIRELLLQSLPSIQDSRLYLSELDKRQSDLFQNAYSQKVKNIDLRTAWSDTHTKNTD